MGVNKQCVSVAGCVTSSWGCSVHERRYKHVTPPFHPCSWHICCAVLAVHHKRSSQVGSIDAFDALIADACFEVGAAASTVTSLVHKVHSSWRCGHGPPPGWLARQCCRQQQHRQQQQQCGRAALCVAAAAAHDAGFSCGGCRHHKRSRRCLGECDGSGAGSRNSYAHNAVHQQQQDCQVSSF